MPRTNPDKFPLFDEFYDEFEFESEIIDTLKKFREEQRLSQYDLAKKTGIPQSSLARFESGKATNPTLIFLKKIVIGLGLKITISKEKPMV